MLGITSDVSVGARGKFPLTELDQKALYKPLTKWNTSIDRVDRIPHAVRSAFRAMIIGTNYLTDVALVGDALLGLRVHLAAVQARIGRRRSDVAGGVALAARARAAKQAFFAPLDRPIKPERVVNILNRLLPPCAMVVADPGTPCPYLTAYFNAPQSGRHFITNRAHRALGFVMSAGVGAAIRRPDPVVVAVMGDGPGPERCRVRQQRCQPHAAQ